MAMKETTPSPLERIHADHFADLKAYASAKTISERESAFKRIAERAEKNAELHVPGLKSGTLTALRSHLLSVKMEHARFTKLLDGGNPSVGGKLAELVSEADFLIRRIRSEENRMLDAITPVEG